MIATPPSFETSDKYLGSFFLAHGIALVGYARVSRRRVVFRFQADERLHELLRRYRSQAPIPLVPLQWTDALRRLKNLARACPLPAVSGTPGTALPAADPSPDDGVPPADDGSLS